MLKLEDYQKSADYICQKIGRDYQIAIVLGSGLGSLAEKVEHKISIPYEEIPNFPRSTVLGHKGELIAGTLGGKKVLMQNGRFHYYEGYTFAQSAFAVRVFALLGVKKLLLTNAAGGINQSFQQGDLMLIQDHIKFFDDSPLRGPNLEEFGPRFHDMSYAYSKQLGALAQQTAKEAGFALQSGVYAYMPGPSFETPAEIRALRILGADAVGMSTVAEVITAVHCGLEVMAISCISNMAAGILDQPLTHQEVMDTAKLVEEKLCKLMCGIVEKI